MKFKIVAITQPLVDDIHTAEQFVAYVARVSNPGNQTNNETAPKLLQYLMQNQHWSPFEMAHLVAEIDTTIDISVQVLRHRSFAFQQFSTRYAFVDLNNFVFSEARLQDTKNRQNSIEVENTGLQLGWEHMQRKVMVASKEAYDWAVANGIAKEVARKVLPYGLTPTKLYMAGSIRSWLHYIMLRRENGTQKEHKQIAEAAELALIDQFPALKKVLTQ